MNTSMTNSSRILFAFALVLLAGVMFLATPRAVYAANSCVSNANGSWTDTGTWNSCGGLTPQDGDSVAISHVVAIDSNTLGQITIASLTVNSGGTLTIGDSTQTTGYVNKQLTIMGNITINTGGTITCIPEYITYLDTTGDFIRTGTFNSGISVVTFEGDLDQAISGGTSFYDLTVNNIGDTDTYSVDSSSAITVTHNLAVIDGLFTPSDGSQFYNVNITYTAGSDPITGVWGVLTPFNSGDTWYVSGNWYGNGTFTHNNGTVVFNGSLTQTITTSQNNNTFYNLTVSSNCATPSDDCEVKNDTGSAIVVQNNLDITKGLMYPGDYSDFGSVTIESDGILKPYPPSVADPDVVSYNGIFVRKNWINNGNFIHNGGKVTFRGPPSQTIGGSSMTTFNDLAQNNTAGVSLLTDATVNNLFRITNGRFTVLNHNLIMGPSAMAVSVNSAFSTTRLVVADIGVGSGKMCKDYSANGSYFFPIGDVTGTAEYTPASLNFTSGTYSSGQACVNLTNAKHPYLPPSYTNYINRYWTVTTTGITSFSADVNFYFVHADWTGVGSEPAMHGLKYDTGPGWKILPLVDLSASITNHRIFGTVTNFSDFTAGEVEPTAVDLLNFKSFRNFGMDVTIAWETVSEVSTTGFNIYRSATKDGVYIKLNGALISAKKAGLGEGDQYTFRDSTAKPGQTYYYRLEAVGTGSEVLYSSELVNQPYNVFLSLIRN